MPVWGVTAAGFAAKPMSQILREIEADQATTIAADIDQSQVVWLGQQNTIMAQKLSEVWDILPVAFNATNRGQSEGASLDNTGQLIGSLRDGPSQSTVYATCILNATGTYPAGSLVAHIANLSSQQAANALDVVVPTNNPDGSPVSVSHPYTAGGVLFAAPLPGPNFANALLSAGLGSFNVTVPVSGWVSVVDTSEPVIGSLGETDTPYRTRQTQELGAQGSGTLPGVAEAIVKALEAAPSPVAAKVQMYENTSLVTDADGIPAKSYLAVIFDGIAPNTTQNDPIIANALWKTKPAGLQPYGTTTIVVLDSQGVQRRISYSRATQVPVFLTLNVAIQAAATPAQVASLVSTAVIQASQGQPFLLYGQTIIPPDGAPATLLPGVDVVGSAFGAIAQGQAGVVKILSVQLGLFAGASGTLDIRLRKSSIGIVSGVVVNCTVFQP